MHAASCLCGQTQIEASFDSYEIGTCHCSMCRKWSAGPFMSLESKHKVNVSPAENVGVFVSSEWAERAFCKLCGSCLYYKLRGREHYYVPVDLFESLPEVKFTHQVFIDEKPEHYDFANETHNMTGAEIFAMFASES